MNFDFTWKPSLLRMTQWCDTWVHAETHKCVTRNLSPFGKCSTKEDILLLFSSVTAWCVQGNWCKCNWWLLYRSPCRQISIIYWLQLPTHCGIRNPFLSLPKGQSIFVLPKGTHFNPNQVVVATYIIEICLQS